MVEAAKHQGVSLAVQGWIIITGVVILFGIVILAVLLPARRSNKKLSRTMRALNNGNNRGRKWK